MSKIGNIPHDARKPNRISVFGMGNHVDRPEKANFDIFLSNIQCLLFIDPGSFCAELNLIRQQYREISRF